MDGTCACSFFHICSLDPHNSRAREGIERVEKHSDLGLDATYDVEVEDMEGSENEVTNWFSHTI